MSVTTVAAIGSAAALLLLLFASLAKAYRDVEPACALVISSRRTDPRVAFTRARVWPIVERAELMDLSPKRLVIERRGQDGLICKDHIRADVVLAFVVKIEQREADVLQVANLLGCSRASDREAIESVFHAKFSQAMKSAAGDLAFLDLYDRRDEFRRSVVDLIGGDLSGFTVQGVAIEHLDQTPLALLDPSNLRDAKGIEKASAPEHVREMERRRSEFE